MRIAKLRNPFDALCAATHFRNAAAEAARTAKTFLLIAKLRNQWNEDVVNVLFFDTGQCSDCRSGTRAAQVGIPPWS